MTCLELIRSYKGTKHKAIYSEKDFCKLEKTLCKLSDDGFRCYECEYEDQCKYEYDRKLRNFKPLHLESKAGKTIGREYGKSNNS